MERGVNFESRWKLKLENTATDDAYDNIRSSIPGTNWFYAAFRLRATQILQQTWWA